MKEYCSHRGVWLLCVPRTSWVRVSIFQKHLMGSAPPETLCCPDSGIWDPTLGCLVGQWVQTLWGSRCLGRPCAIRRPPARQEVLGGGQAGGLVGLISSLLTNPFTHEQAERDGAWHKASQHRSSSVTAVSSLGHACVKLAAGTPQGAHLPEPWVGW